MREYTDRVILECARKTREPILSPQDYKHVFDRIIALFEKHPPFMPISLIRTSYLLISCEASYDDLAERIKQLENSSKLLAPSSCRSRAMRAKEKIVAKYGRVYGS